MSLKIASLLCFLLLFIHSYLGEKYILMRLFKRDNIPHLFGSDFFTKATLRFCWHIMTVMGWGFSAIMWTLSTRNDLSINEQFILYILSLTFFISGALPLIFTRGKHLSWIVLWLISILILLKAH